MFAGADQTNPKKLGCVVSIEVKNIPKCVIPPLRHVFSQINAGARSGR
jgi:hypothetical protein